MALNDQIQDELSKALAKVQATSTSRAIWQEQFDRQPVVSPDNVQAAKAIEGFAGSWAAQAGLVDTGTDLLAYQQTVEGTQPQLVTSHLGRPGVPESNFPLYAWGTNKNEPAFLGHPISFSIVGPTLRHKSTNWQWLYIDLGGTEYLALDAVAYDGGTPKASTIAEAYGITSIPDGGLYLVVSQTGAPAEIDILSVPTAGGVGDGVIDTVGGRAAVTEKSDRASRYEIFRVTAIPAPDRFQLDSGKRFSDFFNIPAGPAVPVVRAITLFKPFAARMASIPGATPGRNKVFLTVTPETSANGDLLPPLGNTAAPTTTPNTWVGGNFADYDASLAGVSSTYSGEVRLPVMVPRGTGRGRLQTNRYPSAGGLPFAPGTFKITNHVGSTVAVRDIIHVRKVSQSNPDYGVLWTVYDEYGFGFGQGFYEVSNVAGATITCRALPQVDTRGNIFYGPVVFNASIDLDGIPVAATAGVQIKSAAVAVAQVYSITIANTRTGVSNTYSTGAAPPGTTASAIGTVLVGLISAGAGDPNVTAFLNVVGVNDVTIELTAIVPGVAGNAITIDVSPEAGSTIPTMYKSGQALGTTTGDTSGYTGTITPTIGHGIGEALYRADLDYTIHDNVSELWQGRFDAARVQSNRLANLIDPTWNKQALSKLQAVTSSQVAAVAGKADKAIFDTSSGTKGNANPGSLLDLGFRMVLFPAKDNGGGRAVPDWDKPIATQNVTLDSSINEAQYLYIDYASGAVVCSHEPDPTDPACTLAPNGIVGTGNNNPRGDIVLFASMVPFSRQPQQTSGGVRVTTSEEVPFPVGNTYTQVQVGSQDVLGARTAIPLAGTFLGVNQTLASQTVQDVYLETADFVAPASTTPANPTITVAAPAPGDSLTFYLAGTAYSVILTATAGVPGPNEFQIGFGNPATAANLGAAINGHAQLSQILYAQVSVAVVNVFTRQVGTSATLSILFPYAPGQLAFSIATNAIARLVLPLGIPQYPLTSQGSTSVLPSTGWFDVIAADTYEPALTVTDGDDTVRRVATFWYGGKELVYDSTAGTNRTKLLNVFGGAEALNDIDLSAKSYLAVFRKADVLPNDLAGQTGTPFQLDTTEGFASRSSTLRFAQGTTTYGPDGVLIDLSGAFVRRRGDTMSGSLTVSLNTALNPSEVNQTAILATGNGTGDGVSGTSGPSGVAGVSGSGAFGSNAIGVRGVGNGSGSGVSGEGGATGAGVYGRGARGVVAESVAIATYPQARIVPAGLVPPSGNLAGDLWVPGGAAPAAGHLLVSDGTNYLDAYAQLTQHVHLPASVAGYRLTGSMAASTSFSLGALELRLSNTLLTISSSTSDNPMEVTTSVAHGLITGNFVCINNHTLGADFFGDGIWKINVTGPTTFTVPFDATPWPAGGATGNVILSFPYQMPMALFTQTGGAASSVRFDQTVHISPWYKSLPVGVVLTMYHRVSTIAATPTYTLYANRYRASDGSQTAGALVTTTNYANTLLQTTTVTNVVLTTALGALAPGDEVNFYLIVTTDNNGTTVAVFDTVFEYTEAYYKTY